MVIADRLKTLREAKGLSQGDIETRTGLLRCYVSRVENGHTVPSVETLEKFAGALEIALYQMMFDGDHPPPVPKSAKGTEDSLESSRSGKSLMKKLVPLLSKMDQDDRNLILAMAGRVSKKKNGVKRARKAASNAVAQA
ncbi:MAG TPA: helix-turn-helix domain-containing protein [Candidatus Acidoferrum sp.]|jgi:transcriptional regulator with XRE-family HTH domain